MKATQIPSKRETAKLALRFDNDISNRAGQSTPTFKGEMRQSNTEEDTNTEQSTDDDYSSTKLIDHLSEEVATMNVQTRTPRSPYEGKITMMKKREGLNYKEDGEKENLTVYSGPTHLPSQYIPRSCVGFRQSFFKPEEYTTTFKKSRYMIPNIAHYFQEAHRDGGFYNYINSRPSIIDSPMAVEDDHDQDLLDDLPALTLEEVADDADLSSLSADEDLLNHPPVRKWHQQMVPVEPLEDELTDDTMEDAIDRYYSPESTPTKEFREKRTISPTPSYELPIKKKQKQTKKNDRKEVDKVVEVKLEEANDETSANTISKKETPNKETAIQMLYDLTKFLMNLKDDKSLSYECVICFSEKEDQIIQCNNPFCEVKVHSECYWKDITTNKGSWKCDRCITFDQDNDSTAFLGTHCALCPETTGLFCKLNGTNVDIPWAHYACALEFLSKSDITNDFYADFYDINFENYEKTCNVCDSTILAGFGAKVELESDSEKAFHVTCVQRETGAAIDEIKTMDSSHILSENITSSPSYENYASWVTKRDKYIDHIFNKAPEMFSIDIWKRLATTHMTSIKMGTPELNEHYGTFLSQIYQASYGQNDESYYSWVDYSLKLIARKFSKRQFEKMGSLSLGSFTSRINYDFKHSKTAKTPKLAKRQTKLKRAHFLPKKKKDKSVLKTKSTIAEKARKVVAIPPKARQASMEKETGRTSRKLLESKVLLPSDDLICTICTQHNIPKERIDSLSLKPGHIENLEKSAHTKKPGYTGNGDHWDPRVFIKCSQCGDVVHCGCPEFPIKNYPSKHETYICLQCDPHEDEPPKEIVPTKRAKKVINYKV